VVHQEFVKGKVMDRGNFLKLLGVGAVAAPVLPKLSVEPEPAIEPEPKLPLSNLSAEIALPSSAVTAVYVY
jgi:hypothetical protein